MLVLLAGDQILTPAQVCQNCLMADRQGQPRWQDGQLRCGQSVAKPALDRPHQFECPMGFRILSLES